MIQLLSSNLDNVPTGEIIEIADECYGALCKIWDLITTEELSDYECIEKIAAVFIEMGRTERYGYVFG